MESGPGMPNIRLIGVDVLCIKCQKNKAKWLLFNFPLCDDCIDA